MRLPWIALAAIACGGGGGGGDDAATDGAGHSGTTSTSTTLTCDVPQYDLLSLTCTQLSTALTDSVHAADWCTSKDDCVVLRAECEHWYEAGCWYPANGSCFGAAEIGAFNDAAASCGGDDVCGCGSPPDVDCVNGTCTIL